MLVRAAMSSRMLEYPHCWQLLKYDFLSRPTLTRARESGVRWHGTVGKNVSQPKHCQTHHSETGTKCPDFCLEENGLFCHLWFLKQHCLLLLLLLNRCLQLQLEVKLHAFSAEKKIKKKNQKHGVRIFEYLLVSLGVYSGTSLHCCAQLVYISKFLVLSSIPDPMSVVWKAMGLESGYQNGSLHVIHNQRHRLEKHCMLLLLKIAYVY